MLTENPDEQLYYAASTLGSMNVSGIHCMLCNCLSWNHSPEYSWLLRLPVNQVCTLQQRKGSKNDMGSIIGSWTDLGLVTSTATGDDYNVRSIFPLDTDETGSPVTFTPGYRSKVSPSARYAVLRSSIVVYTQFTHRSVVASYLGCKLPCRVRH